MSRAARVTCWRALYGVFLFVSCLCLLSQLALLEKVMRHFIWSNDEPVLVSVGLIRGRFVVRSEGGGVGISPLCHMNEALKTKQLCRFVEGDNAL